MLIPADQNPSVTPGCLLPAVAQGVAKDHGLEAYWSQERKKWVALPNIFFSDAEEVDVLNLWRKMRGFSHQSIH